MSANFSSMKLFEQEAASLLGGAGRPSKVLVKHQPVDDGLIEKDVAIRESEEKQNAQEFPYHVKGRVSVNEPRGPYDCIYLDPKALPPLSPSPYVPQVIYNFLSKFFWDTHTNSRATYTFNLLPKPKKSIGPNPYTHGHHTPNGIMFRFIQCEIVEGLEIMCQQHNAEFRRILVHMGLGYIDGDYTEEDLPQDAYEMGKEVIEAQSFIAYKLNHHMETKLKNEEEIEMAKQQFREAEEDYLEIFIQGHGTIKKPRCSGEKRPLHLHNWHLNMHFYDQEGKLKASKVHHYYTTCDENKASIGIEGERQHARDSSGGKDMAFVNIIQSVEIANYEPFHNTSEFVPEFKKEKHSHKLN